MKIISRVLLVVVLMIPLLGTDCSAPLDYIIFEYRIKNCDAPAIKFSKQTKNKNDEEIVLQENLNKGIQCQGIKRYCVRNGKFHSCNSYVKIVPEQEDCRLLIGFGGGITSGIDAQQFVERHPEFLGGANALLLYLTNINPVLANHSQPKPTLFRIHGKESMAEGVNRWCNDGPI